MKSRAADGLGTVRRGELFGSLEHAGEAPMVHPILHGVYPDPLLGNLNRIPRSRLLKRRERWMDPA